MTSLVGHLDGADDRSATTLDDAPKIRFKTTLLKTVKTKFLNIWPVAMIATGLVVTVAWVGGVCCVLLYSLFLVI